MFHARPARKVCAYRPRLEVLEDRALPSTFLVDHLADDMVGSGLTGSLRYALTNATDGDHITFGVTGTIQLTDALPGLTHNISIDGPGPDLLTVSGPGEYGPSFFPIFGVGETTVAAISGLTIANGAAGLFNNGGGIVNGGSLTVSDCTVTGNFGGGIANLGVSLTVNHCTITDNEIRDGDGGGIYNDDGTVTVDNSTIANNIASLFFEGDPGGYGGGVANEDGGSMTIANSTISGNTAFGWTTDSAIGPNFSYAYGGGIWNGVIEGGYIGSDLVLTNCTVTGNAVMPFVALGYQGVGRGGGIASGIGDFPFYPSTLTINNSTISGNTGGGISAGHVLSLSNSIVAGNGRYDIDGSFTDMGHNLIGGNPLLGPLQDNGGPTQTMALLAGSPALNAGDPAQLGVADQRGVIRSGGVNIGAYQASASAFVLTAPATVTAGAPFDLTVKAVDPFGQTALGYTGTVTFSTTDTNPAVVLPADYTFTTADAGLHTFSGGVTLVSAGSQTLTASDTMTSSLTGSATVVVAPAAADHFVISVPASVTAGMAFDVTVTVVDAYGNSVTDYQGTVTFSSTDADPGVILPADYLFMAADGGTHTFAGGVTLLTPGDEILTATDPVSGIGGSVTVTL
jgi:hypothetical protein